MNNFDKQKILPIFIFLSIIISGLILIYTYSQPVDDGFGFGNLVFLLPYFAIPISLTILWWIYFIIISIKTKESVWIKFLLTPVIIYLGTNLFLNLFY